MQLLLAQLRKRNTYTLSDLIQNINSHDDVTALRFESHCFKDWDTVEDRYITKPQNINVNHIFTVNVDRDPNKMWIQKFDGDTKIEHTVVKRKYREIDWSAKQEAEPATIDPPGIQDIKWRELYDKWWPLVPENMRGDYKYYNEAKIQVKIGGIKSRSRRKHQLSSTWIDQEPLPHRRRHRSNDHHSKNDNNKINRHSYYNTTMNKMINCTLFQLICISDSLLGVLLLCV